MLMNHLKNINNQEKKYVKKMEKLFIHEIKHNE